MKYIDAYNSEERLEEKDLYTIYLHHESDWWRAYEWSAYLCEMFPNGLGNGDKLKPIRKKMKEKEDGLISVGMKLKSFEKYLPSAKVEQVEESIKIDVKDFFDDNFTLENYKDTLLKWKLLTPIKHEEKKIINDISVSPFIKDDKEGNETTCLLDIMKEILRYDCNNHTLNENNTFLFSIKEKLNILLY